MSAVRSLLDKIEMSKLNSLPDSSQPDAEDPFNAESKTQQQMPTVTQDKGQTDELDFLSDPLSSNPPP